jgi:hypothetical protein
VTGAARITSRLARVARSPWLWACLLYLVVAACELGPCWWGEAGLLVGGGNQPDWTGTAWTFWWVAHAISEGLNPTVVSGNFYPVGQAPLSQYNALDGLLAAPLVWAFGVGAAYNLFALLAVWTTAIGSHVLARTAGASHGAAVVAGLSLPTSHYMVRELEQGRLSQAFLLPWLLGLAGLVRLARGEGRPRLAVLTGLAVAATHLGYWYYGLFLTMAAIPFWLAGWREWRRTLPWLLLAAVVTVLFCGPAVVHLSQTWSDLPGVARDLPASRVVSTLARGEMGLNEVIRNSSWLGWPFIDTALPTNGRLSLPLVLLALLPLPWGPRDRWLWLSVAVVGYLLTIGPFVKVQDGSVRAMWLPYLLLYDHLPFFERLWWPNRGAIIVVAAVGTLAALHLDMLAARLPRWRPLLLGIAALACALDLPLRLGGFPVPAAAPPTYESAVYDKLDGALITLPVDGSDAQARDALWMQTQHQRPISIGLGSWIEGHRPPGWQEWVEGNKLVRALSLLSERKWDQRQVVRVADVEALRAQGFRWIVLDPQLWTSKLRQPWTVAHRTVLSELWGAADLSSNGVLAWRIEPLRRDVALPASVGVPGDLRIPTAPSYGPGVRPR